MKKILLQVIIFALAVTQVQSVFAEKTKIRTTTATSPKIFRYKNDVGVMVTTYVLPPDVSGKGYEIISPQGDVLEVIKPAPTAAEKQAFLNAIDQDKYDKSLMLKYGSLAELMKAQKRKSEELDAKMSVLKGNFSNIKAQIDAEQVKAANFERQGRPVPDTTLSALEALYANYEQTESTIHEREKEIAEEKGRYEQELTRYKQLKGLK